jgi:hypothetical protein
MRVAIFVLGVLGAVTGAWADPNDLSGGVLMAHYEAAIQYCIDPTDYCALYALYPISDPSQAIVQLPDETTVVWYVIAAWMEPKTWCGTEFGFNDYVGAAFTYYNEGACFPVTGGLEIPTTGWPGPGEGTAFVTTGDPWSGNYLPVYWFAGKGYEYYGPTIIMIHVDPPTGFCGFSNCMNPPASFTVPVFGRGGMGIGEPGIIPGGGPSTFPWACCIPVAPWCVEVWYEWDCLALGGTWHQTELCYQITCPQEWACCIGGVCQMMFEENCNLVGGTWMQGVACDPNPCPAVCCIPSVHSPHGCEIMLETACAAASGFWHPEWVTCDPNPCEIYTPVENASWGEIKSLYR